MGSRGDCGNYRIINVMSIPGKTKGNVMINRIRRPIIHLGVVSLAFA